MKYCKNCGTPCEDTLNYCKNCGMPLETDSYQYANNNQQNTNYYSQNNYNTYNSNGNPYQGGQSRSIAVAVILTIITCGIYGIYWMIQLNDEINFLSGEPQATSGGMVLLFTLLTCGVYGLYWNYKMGERVDRIKGTYGNSGILYLILSLCNWKSSTTV